MCTMNESREESDDIISITSDEMAVAAANIEQTVKQREEEYIHTYSTRSTLQLFRRVSVNEVLLYGPLFFFFLIRVKLIIIIIICFLIIEHSYYVMHAPVVQVHNILLLFQQHIQSDTRRQGKYKRHKAQADT